VFRACRDATDATHWLIFFGSYHYKSSYPCRGLSSHGSSPVYSSFSY